MELSLERLLPCIPASLQHCCGLQTKIHAIALYQIIIILYYSYAKQKFPWYFRLASSLARPLCCYFMAACKVWIGLWGYWYNNYCTLSQTNDNLRLCFVSVCL